jgi:hypothetical protein
MLCSCLEPTSQTRDVGHPQGALLFILASVKEVDRLQTGTFQRGVKRETRLL